MGATSFHRDTNNSLAQCLDEHESREPFSGITIFEIEGMIMEDRARASAVTDAASQDRRLKCTCLPRTRLDSLRLATPDSRKENKSAVRFSHRWYKSARKPFTTVFFFFILASQHCLCSCPHHQWILAPPIVSLELRHVRSTRIARLAGTSPSRARTTEQNG